VTGSRFFAPTVSVFQANPISRFFPVPAPAPKPDGPALGHPAFSKFVAAHPRISWFVAEHPKASRFLLRVAHHIPVLNYYVPPAPHIAPVYNIHARKQRPPVFKP